MDSSYDVIPEEFVDPIMNELAYDPVRLPITEDPAQVLYNRRTLEKIWDTKHEAVNPYTRQPFNIRNAIPQTELSQQMRQYIVENNINCLEVISADYTKPLSSTDLKHLLSELLIAAERCGLAGENINDKESEASWKVLWQKLNLLRLYCQYSVENRNTFLSVKGYEYLLNVINPTVCHWYPSIEDTKEAYKEVAKIVDIIGLKDYDLQVVPEENVLSFLDLLYDLLKYNLLKIQTIVLRIFRRMYEDCFDCLFGRYPGMFSFVSLDSALCLLDHRRNSNHITNEDLFNGTTILKLDWDRQNSCGYKFYVDTLVNVVIICISRFQDLYAAATHRAQAKPCLIISLQDDHDDHEEKKNIYLIIRALDQSLFVIDSIVRPDELLDESRAIQREILKHRLQMLDIVKDIVKMVELVLAGIKFFQSSHLALGLNIAALLCQEDRVSVITRRNAVKVFEDFLGSHFVEGYDAQVKLLLQDIVRNAS